MITAVIGNSSGRLLCTLGTGFLSNLYRQMRNQCFQCSVRFPVFKTGPKPYGQLASQCDVFRSGGSCGRNKTLPSSIFCATILPFPPTFTCLVSLSLSLPLSFHPQESTLPPPPPPPLPDPGQYDLAIFYWRLSCATF